MRLLLLFLVVATLGIATVYAAEPDILLVDEGGAASLETFYGPLCLSAGRTYQVWTVSKEGAVPATGLDLFRTVMWLTGDTAKPMGIEGGAANLARYLQAGGRVILAGDHAAEANRELLASAFGLEFKRFSPALERVNGRMPDVISQGWSLHLSPAGAEAAEYAKDDEARPRAETVFYASDRGNSRLMAARVESLEGKGHRAAWFGFDLQRVKDATRAAEVFTRTIRWTSPEPPAKAPVTQFPKLYRGR